jgi:hypothetical protein
MRHALAVVILAALPLAGAEAPKATLADMQWLQGRWCGTALGGFVEEIWSEPRGGAMMGMFRLVKGNDPVFYEFLHVVEVDGSLALRLKHFNRDLTGWEEKAQVREFKLLSIQDGVYSFEGMDFHPSKDTLKVVLQIGSKDGSTRTEVFTYDRSCNAAAGEARKDPR